MKFSVSGVDSVSSLMSTSFGNENQVYAADNEHILMMNKIYTLAGKNIYWLAIY
jgi:hypothetical protein